VVAYEAQVSDITWTTVKRRLGDLIEWDKNPRRLSKHDGEHIKRSMDKFGLADPLVINLDNHLIGGHQRKHLLADPNLVVDVRVPSRQLTEAEAEELAIRLNKAQGQWDFDLLANNWQPPELIEWGFTEEELQIGGFDLDGDAPEDPGAQIDRAEELRVKWGVESGQLWQLGEHRLICGDCTDRAVVERVMGREKARLIWTDPPYGVNYGAKLEAANPMGYRVRMIENDDLTPEKLEEFIRSALKLCAEYSLPGCSIYVACPAGTLLPTLIASFVGSGFLFHWGLVWVKDQLVLGRGDYHFKHENILYGWKDDGAHYFTPDRTQTSVFEYPRPKSSEEHPTMKPVELVEHMIGNSSQKGDTVLEPFSGSGTTLIACERLGRKARAIEISPAYCAVAIDRWSQMGAGTPELIPGVQE
jgi:DNA modification methylase